MNDTRPIEALVRFASMTAALEREIESGKRDKYFRDYPWNVGRYVLLLRTLERGLRPKEGWTDEALKGCDKDMQEITNDSSANEAQYSLYHAYILLKVLFGTNWYAEVPEDSKNNILVKRFIRPELLGSYLQARLENIAINPYPIARILLSPCSTMMAIELVANRFLEDDEVEEKVEHVKSDIKIKQPTAWSVKPLQKAMN